MASCSGSGGNGRSTLTVTETSTSTANNTSAMSWSLTAYDIYGQSWSGTASTGTVTINGTGHAYSYSWSTASTATRTLSHGTQTVAHNSDGTKSISFSFTFSGVGTTHVSGMSGSGSMTLTTIPRKATWVSAPDITVGSAVTFSWTDLSSSFTYVLAYVETDGTYHTIATGLTGGSYTWAAANTAGLASLWTTGTGGNITMRIGTLSGSTVVGTSDSSVKVTIPNTSPYSPSITAISVTEATTSPNVASLVGKFVKGVSKLNLSMTATAGTNTTIKTANFQLSSNGSASYGTSTSTTNVPVNGSGTITITATYTNQRGFTDTMTTTIDVLDYMAPSVDSASQVVRATSGHAEDDANGTYLMFLPLKASVKSLLNGATEKNSLSYSIETSPKGANTWTTFASPVAVPTVSGLSMNSTIYNSSSSFPITNSFDVRVKVWDVLTSASPTTVIYTVPTAQVFMHWDANIGIGVNKYRQNGALDVNGDVFISGLLHAAQSTATVTGTWGGIDWTCYFYRFGGFCWFYMTVVPSAAFTPGSGTTLITIPAGFECAQQHYSYTNNTGFSVVSVNAGNTITSAASGTAAAGSRITILDFYPAQNP